MDLDKTNLQIFLNYFIEDLDILIKIPLKSDIDKADIDFTVDTFNISNRIYLTAII